MLKQSQNSLPPVSPKFAGLEEAIYGMDVMEVGFFLMCRTPLVQGRGSGADCWTDRGGKEGKG